MMKLPSGIQPSSDTTEYLKNCAIKEWNKLFHKALDESDQVLEEAIRIKSLPFFNKEQILVDFTEFCQSFEWVKGVEEHTLYRYPVAAARICRIICEKGALSAESEFNWAVLIGKTLWMRILENPVNAPLFIQIFKEHLLSLRMDSLVSVIFLGSLFAENNHLKLYDLTAHREFPQEWVPALLGLLPADASLVTLENALMMISKTRQDLDLDALFDNPDSAYHLMNISALSSLQKNQHPLLNHHLESLVRGMRVLLKNPEFRQRDLKIYNHLTILLFFAFKDVRQCVQLLNEYVNDMEIKELDWSRFVSDVFNMIGDVSDRRRQFLYRANYAEFPEKWREAYYSIVDFDQPFEVVFTEWMEARDELDLSLFAEALPKFIAAAIKKSFPYSLKKWADGSFEDTEWRAAWDAEQEQVASMWDILCDADWKRFAPLAKEYYAGIVVGNLGQGICPKNLLMFKEVQLPQESHFRLMRLLAAHKHPCEEAELHLLKGILNDKIALDQCGSLISVIVPSIENDSEEVIKRVMNRMFALFCQGEINSYQQQQLWLFLTMELLHRRKDVGLKLVIRERLIMNWQGRFPAGLQTAFQQAALKCRVNGMEVLELYHLMGRVAFIDENSSDKAMQYLLELTLCDRIPIGSLIFILDAVFGENTIFNHQSIKRVCPTLLKKCLMSTGYFFPDTNEEFVQMLWKLTHQGLHRHFQTLYTDLDALIQKYHLSIQLEEVFAAFEREIRSELHSIYRKKTPKIPAELQKTICRESKPFLEQVVKLYMEALLTGKTS